MLNLECLQGTEVPPSLTLAPAAVLLGKAVEQNPLATISLYLDISSLPLHGLPHIQNTLQRPTLEILHIHCSSLEPRLLDSVWQILVSAQWPTLQSLVLTGMTTNE